jgi:hypothetical protein
MMKKSPLKLMLRRETLRVLAGMELAHVAAGTGGVQAFDTGNAGTGCPHVVLRDSAAAGAACPPATP